MGDVVAVATGVAGLGCCGFEASSPSASILSSLDSTPATAWERKDPHLDVEGAAMAGCGVGLTSEDSRSEDSREQGVLSNGLVDYGKSNSY